ncbi:MAG: calcium-binding protein [Oscillatoriales cyanobacterium RM2_1_1]|nr:calcium-binding protein [Oscillatoriales cyanobacterium SM2_3_0]NJO46480.1 calcium-binding protein [Oscillatoriales cyanobacterium RM2_1_1]
MTGFVEDEAREQRIDSEVIVDAYTEEEQVLGWYYYLDNKLSFPFQAKWSGDSATDKKAVKTVQVVGMPPEEECMNEMQVEVQFLDTRGKDTFSVPLANIQPVKVDANTAEAIADWHYWVEMDYAFG